jgi:hypothetical protein
MTAKYPVDISDQEGIVDAVNYLLSGPAGLGQNFAGFSSYIVAYLTGNFRIPFSQPTSANLYVAPISLSNAEELDDRTIKYTFASAQPSAPFSLGNGLTVTGVTPSNYNSSSLSAAGTPITQIGVVECTTTYVIVRTRDPITTPLGTYVSGGSISYTSMDALNSTDCDVRVTVTGGTDRVFVSGQLDQIVSYEVLSGPADMTVYADITRYKAFTNDNPVNPDFIFDDATTIVSKAYEYTGLTGTGSIPLIETVFTGVLDEPDPAYYRYILEVYFETVSGDIQVTTDELRLRSITAQVIKQ